MTRTGCQSPCPCESLSAEPSFKNQLQTSSGKKPSAQFQGLTFGLTGTETSSTSPTSIRPTAPKSTGSRFRPTNPTRLNQETSSPLATLNLGCSKYLMWSLFRRRTGVWQSCRDVRTPAKPRSPCRKRPGARSGKTRSELASHPHTRVITSTSTC